MGPSVARAAQPVAARARRRPRLAALAAVLALVVSACRASQSQQPDSGAGPAEWNEQQPSSEGSSGAVARDLEMAPIASAVRELDADVRRLGGQLGACVVDVDSGRVVAAAEAHRPLNPASNQKLVTAALVLSELGPAHRFTTGLYGARRGGTVPELVLRGNGDPSLRAAHLWSLAHDLYDAGVRTVDAIRVDQSAFDDKFVPPGFEAQPTEWAAFRAPVSAVALESNTITVVLRPRKEGSAATATVEPPGFAELTGTVTTTGRGGPQRVSVDAEPSPGRLVVRLAGQVPEDGAAVRVVRRVDDPRLYAGFVLNASLRAVGIETRGDIRLGGEQQTRLLAAHRSAPVGELVAALGKESDNFYAETLFKAVALEVKGKPGRTEVAADLASAYLEARGATDAASSIRNGPGLFDGGRTTAWALATLLRTSYRDPTIGPEFVAQLAVGGLDGTLKNRLRRWAALRAVRAKTGTLEGVAALSGYVLGPPGHPPIAFALLVNGVPGKLDDARASIDRVVDAIAAQLHGAGAGAPAAP